jgi:propionyl-CoA carboxylase alpha chain
MPFRRVLIANRGEIVRRAAKTLRKLNIEPVVVYTKADETGTHVREAVRKQRIESYVSISEVVAAARRARADAVFPGYGFLAERADCAGAVQQAGMTFIGPSARAIARLSDKIEAKKFVKALGIPVVPGYVDPLEHVDHAGYIARELGFPVVLKAASGGGGRGLRVIHHEQELRTQFEVCAAEAKQAFGDSRLLLEKYLEPVRHIEVQILGDRHGNLVVFPERECSIQRHNQKLLEESPSPLVDKRLRWRLFHDASRIARAIEYDSVGTVEFLVHAHTKEHFFLEMNARLQVEHAVSEAVTGVDLIEHMIRAASNQVVDLGEPENITRLELDHDPPFETCRMLRSRGWALEARICAEGWSAGSLVPSTGRLHKFRLPVSQPGVRVDSGYDEGDSVSPLFDSLLTKVIAHGETRTAARRRLALALDALLIDGVEHTTGLLRDIVAKDADFANGIYTTRFLKDYALHFNESDARRALQLMANRMKVDPGTKKPIAALTVEYGLVRFDREHDTMAGSVASSGATAPLPLQDSDGLDALSDTPESPLFVMAPRRAPRLLFRGMPITVQRLFDEDELMLWERIRKPVSAAPVEANAWRALHAPMPGILVAVLVSVGDEVQPKQPVTILESMKMRNMLHAPSLPPGAQTLVVGSIRAAVGTVLRKGDLILEFSLPTFTT